jgi:hypothetical protein
MLRTKPLLFFIIKAVVIYLILVAPFSFYDEFYGKIYRGIASPIFNHVGGNGFTRFTEVKDKAITLVNLGNSTQIKKDGTAETTYGLLNVRYLAYLPTVLLISLILASPVPWKRKLISLVAGLLLVTAFIMFLQWLFIMFLAVRAPWINLSGITEAKTNFINFGYKYLVDMPGFSRFLVVVIWLLVTFRMDDLKILKRPSAS